MEFAAEFTRAGTMRWRLSLIDRITPEPHWNEQSRHTSRVSERICATIILESTQSRSGSYAGHKKMRMRYARYYLLFDIRWRQRPSRRTLRNGTGRMPRCLNLQRPPGI